MPASESIELASRLRAIREEQYGEHGGPLLAARLAIPFRTLFNYESGVTLPAVVLLRFIRVTGACSEWLRSGQGPRYTPCDAAVRIKGGDGVPDPAGSR